MRIQTLLGVAICLGVAIGVAIFFHPIVLVGTDGRFRPAIAGDLMMGLITYVGLRRLIRMAAWFYRVKT